MAEMPNVVETEPVEADWGNDIRDRTVQRYNNDATLASENASPTNGDLAFMEDTGAFMRYFGGWKEIIPPGVILPYGGSTAPDGFILCNGASISRTTYARLFNILGTSYGSVDGSSFNVPDMRQRFPLGKAASGTGNTLGQTGGAINHTHTGPLHTHTATGSDPFDIAGVGGAALSNSGDGNTGPNNPPYIVVNFIVKI